MYINPAVFRAYDIRGIVDNDFNPALVTELGRACAALFLEAGESRALVGHDCRLSSPAYHEALVEGLTASGVDVISLGQVPSPLLYFAVRHLNIHAGIMVTASHNPPQYNGFKVWLGQGTLFEEGIQNIRQRMEELQPLPAPEALNFTKRGLASRLDIVPAYTADVLARVGRVPGIKVVVDGGNGVAGPLCCDILSRMGAEVVPLFCEPDGRFPNHHPDPVVEKNVGALRQAVLAHKADLGMGLDGDGDRLGVIDANGRLLFGDELVSIYARDIFTRQPGARILGDVKCSQRLFDDITARGGVADMCRTGHSVVKARLRESGAAMAGELSGHIFFAENWYGFDDATYSAARLLAVLHRLGQPLTALPGWPPAVNTPELNMPCPDAHKFEVVRRAQAYFRAHYPVQEIDGARVLFPHGWGLVRASNTSPSLVLRFEADSPEALATLREFMESPLRQWLAELE